jgi:ubiquinone/menaquinone biosynthesis C-methylase UbiE
MNGNSLLFKDETSEKYFRFSTRRITGIFIKKILLHLKKNNPKNILDIGCGTGYITDIINHSIDANIICCDLNSNRISFAKTQFQLETVIADITYLPFKNSSFDTVLAIEIIEHLPNIESAINEIKRVTNKNVIITVPNDPYFMIANLLRGKNLKSFGNPQDHINHFNKKTFKSTLCKYCLNGEISKNAFLWLIANVQK